MIIGHYVGQITAQGGAEIYLRRIATAQKALGHTVYYFSKYDNLSSIDEITVITVKTDADLYTEATRLNLDLLHLHTGVSLLPPAHLTTIRTLQGHQPYCPSGSKFLARKGCPCDRSYSVAGCLWGHFVDRCGSIRPQKLRQSFQSTQHERQVLSKITTLTNSDFLRSQMIAVGYPESLVRTLYLCASEVVDATAPPQTHPPRYLFAGRLTAAKGLTWLIHAIAAVSVPVYLDIAGDGNQSMQLRSLVDALQLNDQVTFHGWVSSDALRTLVQASRALIFPSVWHEPAGLVAYEAMLNSRAAIASRVGGIPEGVIDGVTGLLVEPNDVAGLARQIERLTTDWELAKQLGEAGRNVAIKKFSIQNHMVQLMQIYQEVLGANPASAPLSPLSSALN